LSAVVFDTSVYIAALRRGGEFVLRSRRAARKGQTNTLPLWLSAVVLEELLVGASDRKARQALRRLEREFNSINRLLVPNLTDWSVTGTVLNQFGGRFGFETVSRSRLTNDALIAMSAARQGLTLQTTNVRDFGKLAEIRAFQWEEIAI
jgi:predicted nucleic acid-binding protein